MLVLNSPTVHDVFVFDDYRTREGRQGSISIRASYRVGWTRKAKRLHMAAKGTSVEVVEELIKADRSSINIADTKGNTALHIAARKGRSHIVKLLLDNNITDTKAVNEQWRLDHGGEGWESRGGSHLAKHGVPSAKTIKPSGLLTLLVS
ncbi:hypothetical protein Bca52824_048139 [Brassica carinata]|uniref:Uncharacterized protein n=1 Tax=Brassica carinata TaxID=52824 RepID=A0A8X7RKL4_BRACI|nr:hypothetical protein Bca52824_048139 [Brassica carinata]